MLQVIEEVLGLHFFNKVADEFKDLLAGLCYSS